MDRDIEKRAVAEGEYIAETGATVRATAKVFSCGKSTVHKDVTERLSEIFLELQGAGAANINLVTGTQFTPSILTALDSARANGLSLPVVWNSGGYETKSTLDALRRYVDIFLPDVKYAKRETAREYSCAPDYPETALAALETLLAISGEPVFADDGRLTRGTVVRLLLLPGRLLEAKTVLSRVFRLCGNAVIYSLMRQYTPQPGMIPPLDRRVNDREYSSLVDHALSLGIARGYTQEADAAEECFIPAFDLTGVYKTNDEVSPPAQTKE